MAIVLLAPLPAAAKGSGGVVLNFNDVDIATMVKFISDLTGKNFVMDDRVKGKISVYSPSKLTPEEAFNVFTSVLELKGFTVIQSGKAYKVVPISSARQEGMRILSGKERGPMGEGYVARVIDLERINAPEAVAFLQPIVSKDGYIAAFGANNLLLVVDSAANIQKVMGILALVDTPQRREGAEIVFLKNASADNVATVLRDWIGGRERAPRPGAQQATTTGQGALIVPDARLNALIIFGSDGDKEDIKKLIALVDVVPPTSSSKINVHYLEHADATDVAKVLDGIVRGATAAIPAGQAATAASAPQQLPFEGSKVSIIPDKATNSLVIMASPADYQNLLQVIRQLDKRRRQVFVQAVIAEVAIDKLSALGLESSVTGGGISGNTAGAGVFDPFSIAAGATPQSSLLFTVLKGLATGSNLQIGGILKAMVDDGAINVLSTPTILTSDNKEAEIFVGENIPLLTQTNLSSTGLSQQSIERKDTGITLRLTPQISEGAYVKLDLYQEISDVKQDKGQATDLVTRKRSAKTAVVVKDKDTVVIGGLIQDRDSEVIRKIPLLGDIPFLGWLFKTKTTNRQKINLMIVLTPRIIRGTDELAEVSDSQKAAFSEAVSTDKPFDLDRELKLTK